MKSASINNERGASAKSSASPSSKRKYKRKSLKNEHETARIPDNVEKSLDASCKIQTGNKKIKESLSKCVNERLKCLDVFRGLCIIIMIFVDDGGGGYNFIQHCPWDGLHVADVAFPWFLWICGVCIPFSLQSKAITETTKYSAFIRILKRSIKLVLLGIMVNTSTKAKATQLEELRFPGVLQRFGICYLVASSLYLIFCNSPLSEVTSVKTKAAQRPDPNLSFYFRDIKACAIPWAVVMTCVLLHTTVTFFLPVPGCPTGYLGPGGLHNGYSQPEECVGGAAGFIDRIVFGTNHIHRRPTSHRVYGSGPFDPEGLLGVLTSILQIWLGVQTGVTLLTFKETRDRVLRFATWSLICAIGGYILCGGFQNQGWIPVNKNMWSLSFVLITSSAALLLLITVYMVIDVWKFWDGSPLMETGMNSILLYLGHEVCHAMLPWHYSYGEMETHASKLIETIWGTFLWVLVALYLHKQQMFFVV